jgi:hypothetical protein
MPAGQQDQARSNRANRFSTSHALTRMLNGLQNRARELAKFRQPFAEPAPQQARDFFGAPVFGFEPHFGLGRKIDDWQFALHMISGSNGR